MNAGDEQVDPAAAALLAPFVEAGEALVWAGRPDAAHFARLRSRLVLMGAFWIVVAGAGFAGFWTTLMSDEYAGVAVGFRILALAVCAAPFAAVGFVAVWGHVPWARRVQRRTGFGLTDRRVLAVGPAFGVVGRQRLGELPLEAVGEVSEDREDGALDAVEVHDTRGVLDPVRWPAPPESAQAAARIRRAAAAHGRENSDPG